MLKLKIWPQNIQSIISTIKTKIWLNPNLSI